jgi:hypothetical protein
MLSVISHMDDSNMTMFIEDKPKHELPSTGLDSPEIRVVVVIGCGVCVCRFRFLKCATLMSCAYNTR